MMAPGGTGAYVAVRFFAELCALADASALDAAMTIDDVESALTAERAV